MPLFDTWPPPKLQSPVPIIQKQRKRSLILSFRVSPSITHSVSQRRSSAHRPPLESARQNHSQSIHSRHQKTSNKRHEAVKHGARIYMSAQALPLHAPLRLGQHRGREPAHGEAKRQGVADDELLGEGPRHVAQRAGAVGDSRVEHAAVVVVHVVLGHAVQQDVHVRANVHVAELQRAGQREDERDELLVGQFLANDLDMRCRAGGQAARERRVVVDVELEQVEEGVGDEGDRAVDLALNAVVELQRLAGLVAGREGDPLQLVVGQLDVLAGVAGSCWSQHLWLHLHFLLLPLTSCGSCIPRGWARRSGTTAEARWRPQMTPGRQPALRRRTALMARVVMEACGGWRWETGCWLQASLEVP
ncbi:hypothetical protein HDV63DRAFT_369164 [Trichoderma sp. SZMC 28014]